MSNHLAIATVTATLQRLLQSVIQQDVDGARVTTLKPNAIGSSTPESGVNLFLYQAATNLALKNGDTKAFRARKGPVRRTTSLDLFYMLSVYGNEAELEPQRLLGSVVRALSDKTVLTPEMIQAAISDAAFLQQSNLVDQTQPLTISPVDMDTEELSKVWSTFFQAPYNLSVAYKVMAVVIDGEISPRRALPVRERQLSGGVAPFAQQPVLEKVVAQADALAPISRTTPLRLTGTNLSHANTQVQIGSAAVTPSAVTAAEILLSLEQVQENLLRAGIQSAQVLHHLPQQSGTIPLRSNAVPFVLRPSVVNIQLLGSEGIDDDPRTGQLQVTTDVPVHPDQQAVVMLNEWSTTNPGSYLFQAPSRPNATNRLEIPFNDVKPGDYLLRLQVDGADSLLTVDTDPNSKTFNWFNGPRVVIE